MKVAAEGRIKDLQVFSTFSRFSFVEMTISFTMNETQVQNFLNRIGSQEADIVKVLLSDGENPKK